MLTFGQRLLARGEVPLRVIEPLSHGLTTKLLHGPSHYLNRVDDQALAQAQTAVQAMFQLDSRNLSDSDQSDATKQFPDS